MFVVNDEERSAVLRLFLIEGKDLSPGNNEAPNYYYSIRLGSQKRKSKVANGSQHPVWKEQFELNVFSTAQDQLELTIKSQGLLKDKFRNEISGAITIDIASLDPETTYDSWQKVFPSGLGEIHLAITISGLTAHDDEYFDIEDKQCLENFKITWLEKFEPTNTSINENCTGHLLVLIYRAEGLLPADINGKSDPFCLVTIGSNTLRTNTQYKTLDPSWNKCFQFDIKDICDCVELEVCDEDDGGKCEVLGRLKIPLTHIPNNQKLWYFLKDKKLRSQAKGNDSKILVEFCLVYNQGMLQLRHGSCSLFSDYAYYSLYDISYA